MIFWGGVLVIAGYAFLTNGYAILGLPLLGLGAWLIWKSFIGLKDASASKSEWDVLIANTQYKHVESNTGIAIDTNEKIVHFKYPKLIKSYPFSDIRSWRYNLSTGGQVNAYGNIGLAGASQVLGQNIRNNRENKAASGFFVTVKDIENPEWRAAMSSERDMKKWMEIFEQFVNEK